LSVRLLVADKQIHFSVIEQKATNHKMNNVWIGCGQITWPKAAEEQVLAEIAQAGYAGAPAGPTKGRTPQETSALFAQFGLKPAPGYFSPDFWKVEREAEILSAAREYARTTRALGLTEMYVATGGFDSYVTARGLTRAQVSGHVTPADSMSDAEWTQFARALTLASAITLEEGSGELFSQPRGQRRSKRVPKSTDCSRWSIARWSSWGQTPATWRGPVRTPYNSASTTPAASKPCT
jgi:hypothetical protein